MVGMQEDPGQESMNNWKQKTKQTNKYLTHLSHKDFLYI